MMVMRLKCYLDRLMACCKARNFRWTLDAESHDGAKGFFEYNSVAEVAGKGQFIWLHARRKPALSGRKWQDGDK